MKKYIGTKQVSAMCIAVIDLNRDGGVSSLLGHDPDAVVEVDDEWIRRHRPMEGGYVVEYEDGYASYSPAAPFEKAYRLLRAGVPPSLPQPISFKVGQPVLVFDRYRLGSRDVPAVVAKVTDANDGVMVDIHPDFKFLLAVKGSEEYWVRPQQLQHVYTAGQEVVLNFGDVMAGIKAGNAYQRKGWNGKGIWIIGQFPDEHSKMTQPYIYIVTNDLLSDNPDAVRGRVPWLASQTDMFAEDWVLV